MKQLIEFIQTMCGPTKSLGEGLRVRGCSVGDATHAEAVVVENRLGGGDGRRLSLSVPDWPGAVPGQFVMLSPGALPAE